MKASAATLLPYTPSSIIPIASLKTTTLSILSHSSPAAKPFSNHQRSGRSTNFPTCKASWSSQNNPITEFNLYELLGVEASSDRAEIKEAYRALQKRCHPDIAGPPGHDMAIVLNEAYALLSDPNSRMAYDKELSKVSDLQGYTGKPIYSTWLGSEMEQRAVFVDEVKCVGCLKCALFAEKTFAIESVYGRARAVAQWADPEYKIQEAIGACPVDCISIVERSNLAALEFIMSKQPRGKVRIGAGNTAGVRTADIFDEVDKFQARYARHQASANNSKESEDYRASKASAIQAIQMISNWLYWQSPTINATPPATQNSQSGTNTHSRPNMKRLKAAAEARKQATTTTTRPKESSSNTDEYWVPSTLVVPQVTAPDSMVSSPTRKTGRPSKVEFLSPKESSVSPLRWGVPMGTGIVAAVVARLQLGEPVGGLKDHIGGSLALAIVNSSWLQVGLAGVTWYLIGMYVVELVQAFRRK
ncbi:hypothetical protein BUALT_Bualt08G0061100 [Buddleja alternifolia]|uniref:J domain-containing protein n=1 Tax=Buddleja alternifolia TaxID=168488 RepID=A0AAV6XF08_9LAMI|nr:hypothetical protein BUALT_Bualt08G0061100 [Buddleja alternifolia]